MNSKNEKPFSRRLNLQRSETTTNGSNHYKVLSKISVLEILKYNK